MRSDHLQSSLNIYISPHQHLSQLTLTLSCLTLTLTLSLTTSTILRHQRLPDFSMLQIQPAMQQMMMTPAAALQTQLQADAPEQKAVCQSLQQITAIIQHTKVDSKTLAGVLHPTLALYVALWPILDMSFTKMGTNELAVEETCRPNPSSYPSSNLVNQLQLPNPIHNPDADRWIWVSK